MELRNGTSLPVEYNLCSATLERRGDGGWDGVPRSVPEAACFAVLRSLAPGEGATKIQEVGSWMPVGAREPGPSLQLYVFGSDESEPRARVVFWDGEKPPSMSVELSRIACPDQPA